MDRLTAQLKTVRGVTVEFKSIFQVIFEASQTLYKQCPNIQAKLIACDWAKDYGALLN